MIPNRRDVGIYPIADASRLTEIPRKTASMWAKLEGYSDLLTFEELISLRVVRRMREDVDLETIQRAERNLARLWNVPRPFAAGRFRTGYRAIFTELFPGQQPVAVGGAFQETLWELIKNDLRDVAYDADDRAAVWSPRPHIVLTPDVQFGQPCIEGTRVTTRTVYQFVKGGAPYDELAEDLDISIAKLRAAYEYEEGLWKRAN